MADPSRVLAAIFDASPWAVVTLRADATVVEWNRAAKAHFGWRSVLFMSGDADEARFDRDILLPGIEFLAKPFTPDELCQRVRAILDGPTATG